MGFDAFRDVITWLEYAHQPCHVFVFFVVALCTKPVPIINWTDWAVFDAASLLLQRGC